MPLFHHPLRALLACCDEVVVVLSPDASLPPLPADSTAVRFARDASPYEGPLAGTAVGLAHVRGEHALVAGADMPGLRPAVLELMTEHAAGSGKNAVLLADARGPRPLPAVLRVAAARRAAEELLTEGERRLRALMARLDPVVIERSTWSTADADGRWLHDVDTPEDLRRD